MKPIVWVRQVSVSTGQDAPSPAPRGGSDLRSVSRLSLADKAAFGVLALGLLALGGVLFAAGLALLLALAAGGLAIGAVAVIRHRLFGPVRPRLGANELPANAVVVPAVPSRSTPAEVPQVLPPPPPGPAPRAD